MIEYDYRLQRNEGDELKTYAPGEIPLSIPNLVLVEGPNSSGKSTLLNLLALAFYALKTEKLNASLKNKIRDLLESEHQKLRFTVKVSNRDGSITILATKDSFAKAEVRVREIVDGKEHPLTPELFQRKYNLIYDIPDNPIERLTQLVVEIKDAQNRYAARVGSLRSAILRIITELKDSRDPKQLENLGISIRTGEGQLSKLKQDAAHVESLLALIERYRFARAYAEVLIQIEDAHNEVIELEKRAADASKQEKRANTKAKQQRDAAIRQIDEMRENHRHIISILRSLLPKEERPSLEVWERIDFDRVLKEFDFSDVLVTLPRYFRGVLMRVTESDRKRMEEARVYADLIRFLRSYRNADIIIPGLDKSIQDFIDILEDASRAHEPSRVLQERITEVIQRFEQLEEDRRATLSLLYAIKQAKATHEDIEELVGFDDEAAEKLTKLNDSLAQLEEKQKFYETECAKREIHYDDLNEALRKLEENESLKPYRAYRESDFKAAIESMRQELGSREKHVRELQLEVDFQKKELSRLAKKKPHKYQDKQEQLDSLLGKCLRLEQKLSKEFASYLASIPARKPDAKLNDAEKGYFSEVGKYLGKRLGKVRHGEGEFRVKSVDLIRRVMTTESGKSIYFSDMGTGQSQSAYLLGLLNTDDKRKIIALFDEVAMMDTQSLQPILRRLRQLFNDDRLLLGVVVQRADTMRVTPIDGEP